MCTPEAFNRYFLLSTGQRISLVTSRFDERQRRLRLRLPSGAKCWDYASLIDVAYQDSGFKGDRFAGCSASQWLAEQRDRRSPDVAGFRRWYEAVVNRHLTELSRRPRFPDNHYSVVIAVPPLEPGLPRRICELGLNRASAGHWLATLRSLTGKGVKAEELEASGVLARLSQYPTETKLSLAQVLEHIDLGHVMPKFVRESRFVYEATAGWDEGCWRIPEHEFRKRKLLGRGYGALHLVRYRHRSLGWSIVRTRYHDLLTERRDWWCVLNDRGQFVTQPVYGFATAAEAMGFAELRIREAFSRFGNDQALAKWERFALPGGDGYEEILIQLDDWFENYTPRHFRTRNVLVHIRTSIHHTLEGKRVLLLDEIQSDWHADLHTKPCGTIPDAPFRKEWPLLSMKLMVWWAQRQGVHGVAWSTAELQLQRWRGYGPPEMLYRKLLPDAAQTVARALNLSVGKSRLNVRANSRRVRQGKAGWEVRNEMNAPVTKSFSQRGQAERFADLTGQFQEIEVPVLWLQGIKRIRSIPLYGAGNAEWWYGNELESLDGTPKSVDKSISRGRSTQAVQRN